MAERFAPIRTVRPTSAPVSVYYDVSPLAQLLRTEETQGMQVARALSGLAPTLMNISQTAARSEMQEGQEAVARIPEEFKGDMAKTNKWFDEQGLPGPFRSIAFREGIGKRVYGQRLSRALEGIRDSYSRVIDENGDPITQAQRAKILQGALDSVGVPDDPLVQRGYLSVKENITSSFLAQSDSAIAANLRRANENQAVNETLDRIIDLVDSEDIESVGSRMNDISDRLREAGLSASGREVLFKAAARYFDLVVSNPASTEGQLERARALVSELMSPEGYGRPPLPPGIRVEFEALEDSIDLALDDSNVNRISRITNQSQGPVFDALAQAENQLTRSEFIDLVEEVTGLSRSDSSQVASRLTGLLEGHNRGVEEDGIPLEEFGNIRRLAVSGEMDPSQLDHNLSRAAPWQKNILIDAYENGPLSDPTVKSLYDNARATGIARFVATAPAPFDDQTKAALVAEFSERYNQAFAANMTATRRTEDWVNGTPEDRVSMAEGAIEQAIQTARSEVTDGPFYTGKVRQAEEVLEENLVKALNGNILNETSLKLTFDQSYAGLPSEKQMEFYAEHENAMREVVTQWLDQYRSQNPDASVRDILTAFDREENNLAKQTWTLLNTPDVSAEGISPPPGMSGQPVGLERLTNDEVTAAGAYADKFIGDGYLWNTPLFNVQWSFTNGYKDLVDAFREGNPTENLQVEFEARRDAYEKAVADRLNNYISLGSDPVGMGKRDPQNRPVIGPSGVFTFTEIFYAYTGDYKLDEEETMLYLHFKSFGNWELSELVPVGTDDRGDTYWETAEGMRFYSMASGRENRVDPVTHLFFKDKAELDEAFKEFSASRTGHFANVMDILGPNKDITPFAIYRAQQKLISVRRGIPTNE